MTKRHIVTFEFTDRQVAESFVDSVTEWLCKKVYLSNYTSDIKKYWGPRYWLYEDASPALHTETTP